MEAPLFGIADLGGYSGGFPVFHSIEEFPQLQIIETRWDIIRDELITSNGFRELNAPHSSELGGWKGMYLNNFGWLNRANIEASPQLVATLGEIPDVVFVAVSILEPGASLAPHWGDSNTTVRCVLGLKVPGKVPDCYLKVDGEMRSWNEGSLLLFSECYLHSAVNLTEERRVVLTIDIIRPEYSKIKSVICANVLAWQTIAIIRSYFKHPIFSGQKFTKLILTPLVLYWRIQGFVQRAVMGEWTKAP
jgi:aspartyl/asparaginyl beta-hydroxylase (cupin superfamily)